MGGGKVGGWLVEMEMGGLWVGGWGGGVVVVGVSTYVLWWVRVVEMDMQVVVCCLLPMQAHRQSFLLGCEAWLHHSSMGKQTRPPL